MSGARGAALALWLWAGAADAQTVTTIVPDAAGSAFATGTTATRAGSITTIDGGRLAGANLFHSFRAFQLGQGDTAHWVTSLASPASIRNVVNRVTGGNASRIEGTLDSTALPNASFFFINPAGIVFGEGAQVNVPGAAYFSTAGELRFADGATFSATTATGSTFTVAAPQSFGFLGASGRLTIVGATDLSTGPSASLAFTAATITIADSSLSARGFTALAVGTAPIAIDLDDPASAALGEGRLGITDSSIAVNGPGTAMLLRAGNLTIDNSLLGAESRGNGAAGAIDIAAGTILIDNLSSIASTTSGRANAGPIRLNGDTIRLRASTITSDSYACGDGCTGGHGADILLRGTQIESSDGSGIFANTIGLTRGGGNIVVSGDSIELVRLSVSAQSLDGGDARGGDGGAITIDGRDITVFGTAIVTGTATSGQAGSITASASAGLVVDSALIGSVTDDCGCAAGDAGAVALSGQSVDIGGEAQVYSESASSGASGGVTIAATDQLRFGAGRISTISSGCFLSSCGGDAGSILLRARSIRIAAGGNLDSSTLSRGQGGQIVIEADDDAVLAGATIVSGAFCEGDCDSARAGEITVRARSIVLSEGSFLGSITAGTSGDAGRISLEADEIAIHSSELSSGPQGCDQIGCEASGRGGDIAISGGSITLAGDSLIDTGTRSTSAAGTITLTATGVIDINGSSIQSDSLDCPDGCDAGRAGNISISAGSIILANGSLISSRTQSSADAGDVTLRATQSIQIEGSAISSDAFGCPFFFCFGGRGGDIAIEAAQFDLSDGSEIVSRSATTQDAGVIRVQVAGTATVQGSTISTNTAGCPFLCDAGAGGAIMIHAARLALREGAEISSNTSSTGAAGSIILTADQALTIDASAVSAEAQLCGEGCSGGPAGDIVLQTASLSLSNGALVSSRTFSGGAAGKVMVAAGSLAMSDDGTISSTTFGSGRAGSVSVTADRLSIDGARISSESDLLAGCSDASCAATGDAGEVTVKAGTLTLKNGAGISSDTFGSGRAGTVSVTADRLSIANAFISSDAAIAFDCADAGCAGTGDAGDVAVLAGTLALFDRGKIGSDTFGSGDAGIVSVTAGQISIDNALISSDSAIAQGCASAGCAATGRAGDVTVAAGTLRLSNRGGISSDTYGSGQAGTVSVSADRLSIENAFISSDAAIASGCLGAGCAATGSAGDVTVAAGTLLLSSGGKIGSDTFGSGDAGQVVVTVGDLSVRNAQISSSAAIISGCPDANCAATGKGGDVAVRADILRLAEAGSISSSTSGIGDAGDVAVEATRLRLTGASSIESQSSGCGSLSCVGGRPGSVSIVVPDMKIDEASTISTASASAAPAGRIAIASTSLALRDGGSITTNSVAGPAGAITITMPEEVGLLTLDSRGAPSVITTSSGSGTGGMISISSPLAVISSGGSILAQGQLGGANVLIASDYFIRSADRMNVVAVDGAFALDSNIYDVSSGTAVPNISFLDASKVLSGQCAGSRTSGESSRLGARPIGPYAAAGERRPAAASASLLERKRCG